MSSTIETEIRDFVQTQSSNKQEITSDQDLLLSGILDSLSIANLLGFVEKKYDLVVPFGDVTVEDFSTTKDIATYVSQRMEKG